MLCPENQGTKWNGVEKVYEIYVSYKFAKEFPESAFDKQFLISQPADIVALEDCPWVSSAATVRSPYIYLPDYFSKIAEDIY